MNDDIPIPIRPRTYSLSGAKPKASVALAVVGEMLDDAESWERLYRGPDRAPRTEILREVRERIADAEARR